MMDITDWLDAQGVPEAHAARDEIERLREALLRLRKWGGIANGNYCSTVMLGVTDWIDGGMVGELPTLPDHAAPNYNSAPPHKTD